MPLSARGLPGAPFMRGLDAPLARARMQAGFVGGVVAPLWRALGALAGGELDEPLRNVGANAAFYAGEARRLEGPVTMLGSGVSLTTALRQFFLT